MRAFGRMMQVLPKTLNADLERDQRMSASEYTALRHLSESESGLLRMSELAQACDMSLSGMTRLTAKLESLIASACEHARIAKRPVAVLFTRIILGSVHDYDAASAGGRA